MFNITSYSITSISDIMMVIETSYSETIVSDLVNITSYSITSISDIMMVIENSYSEILYQSWLL